MKLCNIVWSCDNVSMEDRKNKKKLKWNKIKRREIESQNI